MKNWPDRIKMIISGITMFFCLALLLLMVFIFICEVCGFSRNHVFVYAIAGAIIVDAACLFASWRVIRKDEKNDYMFRADGGKNLNTKQALLVIPLVILLILAKFLQATENKIIAMAIFALLTVFVIFEKLYKKNKGKNWFE